MVAPPRITVTLPTPHELTRRIALVLNDEGLLGDFIVPLNVSRLPRLPRLPGPIESRVNLDQWRYPIPAVSGSAAHELGVAALFRVMNGRNWTFRMNLIWARAAAIDRFAVRRLRNRHAGAVFVMHGRMPRTQRAAGKLGIPTLFFLNHDAWGSCERLTEMARTTEDPTIREEILEELRPEDVDAETRTLRRTGIVVVESERMARQARAATDDEKPIVIIGQGVDPDFFGPVERAPAVGPLRVAQVARVMYGKGVHITDAAVRKAGPYVAWCRLAGWDGKTAPGLARRSTAITFEGGLERSGIRALLQEADVFVLPSVADPMPRAILEAMACGLPVITTPDAGHEEIIQDGVNGFIVPVNDPEAIAALLARLAADPELRQRVGLAARATAEANSWDAFSERFRRVLHAEILPILEGLRVPQGEPVT